MNAAANPGQAISARLVDVKQVAHILGCSWRTVLRLADEGRIPWGLKLGGLRRWSLAEIESFISVPHAAVAAPERMKTESSWSIATGAGCRKAGRTTLVL